MYLLNDVSIDQCFYANDQCVYAKQNECQTKALLFMGQLSIHQIVQHCTLLLIWQQLVNWPDVCP